MVEGVVHVLWYNPKVLSTDVKNFMMDVSLELSHICSPEFSHVLEKYNIRPSLMKTLSCSVERLCAECSGFCILLNVARVDRKTHVWSINIINRARNKSH